MELSLFFPDWYVGGETGHGKMTVPRHAGTDLLGPAFLRGSAGMGQSWGSSLRIICLVYSRIRAFIFTAFACAITSVAQAGGQMEIISIYD